MAKSHDLLPPPPGMINSYLFLSDIHSIQCDEKAIGLALSFFQLVPMPQRKIVLGGDILDIGFIYAKCDKFRHNLKAGNWDDYFVPEVEKEIAWFDEFYSRLRRLVLSDEDIVFVEGNHEQRLRRSFFIDEVPFEYKHNFNLRKVIKAEERNIRLINYHDWFKISALQMPPLYLGHGSYCGMYPIKKHTSELHGGACIFGHTHEIGSMSFKGIEGTTISYNNPCLCKMDAEYLEGKITNWAQGFTMINWDAMNYWVSILRIVNNQIILPTGEKFTATS